MKIIGYARISTHYQNLDSQLETLKRFGCHRIYMEQDSGRNKNRKELRKALNSLHNGDTFVTYKLDRLSRSTTHLLKLLDSFNKKNINFISIENQIDTRTSMGKFFFTIMGAFAEMEAELIRERVLAGLSAAKERGVKLGRPPLNKNEENVLYQYQHTDKTVTEIAKANGISRPTVYSYLKSNNIPYR